MLSEQRAAEFGEKLEFVSRNLEVLFRDVSVILNTTAKLRARTLTFAEHLKSEPQHTRAMRAHTTDSHSWHRGGQAIRRARRRGCGKRFPDWASACGRWRTNGGCCMTGSCNMCTSS
jgi:hypothetical protein